MTVRATNSRRTVMRRCILRSARPAQSNVADRLVHSRVSRRALHFRSTQLRRGSHRASYRFVVFHHGPPREAQRFRSRARHLRRCAHGQGRADEARRVHVGGHLAVLHRLVQRPVLRPVLLRLRRGRRPSTWSPPPRRSSTAARPRSSPSSAPTPTAATSGFPRAEPRCVPVALSVEKTQTRATPTSAPRPLSPVAEVLPRWQPRWRRCSQPRWQPRWRRCSTRWQPGPAPAGRRLLADLEPTFPWQGSFPPPPRDSTRGGAL